MPNEPYDLEPGDREGAAERPEPEPDAEDAPQEGVGHIDAAPLLETTTDPCPGCGKELASGAVVCTACGFDLRSARKLESKAGVEEIPDATDATFVGPGGVSTRALVVLGGIIAVGAMVLSGFLARDTGFWSMVRAVFRSLYDITLHAGTGVVAVMITARVLGLLPGRLEVAGARMLVVFSLFQLTAVGVYPITVGTFGLGRFLWVPAAIGVYYVAAWVLFKRSRTETLLLALAHTVLWAFVKLGESVSQVGGG